MKIRKECYECVIFAQTCLGEKTQPYKWPVHFKRNINGNCENRVFSPSARKNPVQVRTFMSLYRIKRNTGMTSEFAFAEAVCQTSDEVWERIERDDPAAAATARKICERRRL
jgi:hypothetical protein